MTHLNIMKMIGLGMLLAIALTLPKVLPQASSTQDNHVQRSSATVQQVGAV